MAIHVFIRGSSMKRAYYFGKNGEKLTPKGWGVSRWGNQPPAGTQRIVYSEQTNNNCPYIWNRHFWATYCKLPKKNLNIGDIILYCIKVKNQQNGNTEFLCDLVFEVEDIFIWPCATWHQDWAIRRSKARPPKIAKKTLLKIPIFKYLSKKVSTDFVVYDHLSRAGLSHPRKSYISYIASAENSYQPQDCNMKLIDISSTLNQYTIITTSSPSSLDSIPYKITKSSIKIKGDEFHKLMCKNRLIL